jgi:hypothetical protein
MSDLYSNKEIRERAERLVHEEVHACASTMVWELSQSHEAQSALGIEDDILAIQSQEDYETAADEWLTHADLSELRDMADTVGANYELPDTDDDGNDIPATGSSSTDIVAAIQAEHDYARQVCDEARLDPDTHEAYEHWIVSPWFARMLSDRGEMTGELLGLTIWGRCTTGQAIAMDGVVLEIARDLLGAA